MTQTQKKHIYIRVDGDRSTGLGHVVRCIALAEMLAENFVLTFVTKATDDSVLRYIQDAGFSVLPVPETLSSEAESQWLATIVGQSNMVVLDGYRFGNAYQATLKPHVHALICIDDIHAYPFICDAIINHNAYAEASKYITAPHTKLYLGTEYALLRKEFLGPSTAPFNMTEANSDILICLGGADLPNNALKILSSLNTVDTALNVSVVLGPVNKNRDALDCWQKQNPGAIMNLRFLETLDASQMLLCFQTHGLLFASASGVCLEAFSVNIPVICGITADNQIPVAAIYDAKGAAVSVGWYNQCEPELIKSVYLQLTRNESVAKKQMQMQKNVVDKKSPMRIRALFEELAAQ